jgi:hypothetical protein
MPWKAFICNESLPKTPSKNPPNGLRNRPWILALHFTADKTRFPIRDARWFIFRPKIFNLATFWRVLQWKMLVYCMGIWSILWTFNIFYGHLVYFVVVWYIFPRFGRLYQEKSGNPVPNPLAPPTFCLPTFRLPTLLVNFISGSQKAQAFM